MARKRQSFSSIHPILGNQRYVLPTPATEAALQFTASLLKGRFAGGVIHGPYRDGKTWSIEGIVSELAAEIERPVCILRFDCEVSVSSKRQHYDWMLNSVGYSLAGNNVSVRVKQLETFLLSRIRRGHCHEAVLIFDEAQNLEMSQWEYLLSLHNSLTNAGVRAVFLFVGQEDIASLRERLLDERKDKIVGRFMIKQQPLPGIDSEPELARWLDSFDFHSEWPPGSCVTYTEHFFPAAFRSNWRLASLSKAIWRIRREMLAQRGLPVPKRLRGMYFFFIVEAIYKLYGNEHAVDLTFDDDQIARAIDESGYLDSITNTTL